MNQDGWCTIKQVNQTKFHRLEIMIFYEQEKILSKWGICK